MFIFMDFLVYKVFVRIYPAKQFFIGGDNFNSIIDVNDNVIVTSRDEYSQTVQDLVSSFYAQRLEDKRSPLPYLFSNP